VRSADWYSRKFWDSENWTSDPFYGTRGTFFADVNGDHSADAIAVNDTGILVRPSLAVSYGCL